MEKIESQVRDSAGEPGRTDTYRGLELRVDSIRIRTGERGEAAV